MVWVCTARCILVTLFFAISHGAMAQMGCANGRSLYDQAREASVAKRYQEALELIGEVKSTVPRQCRLESDDALTSYEENLRALLAQQEAGGGARPCVPVQTGPTTYACQ